MCYLPGGASSRTFIKVAADNGTRYNVARPRPLQHFLKKGDDVAVGRLR